MPERRTVRLITCVGVLDDLPLLPAFLEHYMRLGVMAERVHPILNAPSADEPQLSEAEDLLARYGVSPADVWIGAYTSGEMWERRRRVQQEVAHAHDWILSADVDEFHVYPDSLSAILDHCEQCGSDCIQGPLIDRLAPSGKLAKIDPEQPLFAQFPVEGDVMCTIGKTAGADDAHGTVKMMAFRATVLPGLGGHNPRDLDQTRYLLGRPLSFLPGIKDPRVRFQVPFRVLHFKWKAGLITALQRRLDTPGASRAGSLYGRRVLDHLLANGQGIRLADIPRTTADTWPPKDWQAHVQWMLAQDQAPSQGPPAAATMVAGGEAPVTGGWRVRQLTFGSAGNAFHSHSYYDIHVLDDAARQVAVHRMDFAERWMTAEDTVAVGVADVNGGGFTPIGESRAWSWQQGPMAQFRPGTQELVWNDREGAHEFVARVHDLETGTTRTLGQTVYAIEPRGRFALGANMARLNTARPGYGYTDGAGAGMDRVCPGDDGIWRIDFDTGDARLILSLAEAATFLLQHSDAETRREHADQHYLYWFNHLKFSPDGQRFTTKLRWREKTLKGRWTGLMGVSLTCNADGTDLRLLARATSHVMWLDFETLYFWQQSRGRVALIKDRAPIGEPVQDLFPELLRTNVHMRHIPRAPANFIYDTPYQEEIDLYLLDTRTGAREHAARFTGHRPHHGPFRCDLHPVPTQDGRGVVVTSLQDGGRQVYLVERDDAPQ